VTEMRVAILGSTGSIGTAALDVLAHLGAPYRVAALSTHSRVDELLVQCEGFRPACAAVTGAAVTDTQRKRFDTLGVELLTGNTACADIARRADVDVVLSAVVGAAGLPAALATVELGKRLLLANKESLVVAGSILMPLAKARGATILPIDSEHSAVLQCLASGRMDEVRKIVLTASGGPFRTTPTASMRNAGRREALKHPTWTMGEKITIDSATMFNKALELIEAAHLFDLPAGKLGVVVHPQSVVHSMVEFVDGSTIAQLSPPDMRTPIQHALTYPARRDGTSKRMNWTTSQSLTFEPVDFEKFPSLDLGFEAIRRGGTCGAALNAANEVAVQAFLRDEIRLGMIFDVVRHIVAEHAFVGSPTLADLLATDTQAREQTARLIERSGR
jgi:1-deoxy-D-xylulose-5-phosphate reductoisomerase